MSEKEKIEGAQTIDVSSINQVPLVTTFPEAVEELTKEGILCEKCGSFTEIRCPRCAEEVKQLDLEKLSTTVFQKLRESFGADDPLDIHSTFDAENGRINATFQVRIRDEEQHRRLREAASGVDQDEGLPALAEGSRWDGEAVEDRTDQNTRVWVANAYPGLVCPGVWFTATREAKEHGAWMPDVRHVIARFDRANGCYWADHVRALAVELLGEADESVSDAVAKCVQGEREEARVCASADKIARDIATRLLAMLDELHEDGQC